jgi:transcriptional regulator with XRE-family HTH domain
MPEDADNILKDSNDKPREQELLPLGFDEPEEKSTLKKADMEEQDKKIVSLSSFVKKDESSEDSGEKQPIQLGKPVEKTESEQVSEVKKPIPLKAKLIKSSESAKSDSEKASTTEAPKSKYSDMISEIFDEEPPEAVEVKEVAETPPARIKLESPVKPKPQMNSSYSGNSRPPQRMSSNSISSSEKASVGQILQEARNRAGLSLEEVEEKTKIKKDYIRSLENDNDKYLPPLVYVSAYVKNLCYLYGIGQRADSLVSSLKHERNEKLVPEQIIQNLEDEKQVNLEEAKKINRIVMGISIAAGLLIVIAGIYFTTSALSGSKTPEAGVETTGPEETATTVNPIAVKRFDEAKLDKFLTAPPMNMTELALPQ